MSSTAAIMPVRVLSWKPSDKPGGSFVGRADIVLGKALEIRGLRVMQTNGKLWIAIPAVPQVDFRTGIVRRDDRGKVDYTGGTILKWVDRDSADKFRHSVLDAIRTSHPGALPEGDGQ